MLSIFYTKIQLNQLIQNSFKYWVKPEMQQWRKVVVQKESLTMWIELSTRQTNSLKWQQINRNGVKTADAVLHEFVIEEAKY